MVFGGPSGIALLDDSTLESVSLECREAALAFMSGVATGWDKLDLARWLTGPYARATRHTRHGERVAHVGQGREVPDMTVIELGIETRRRLRDALHAAALDCGALGFAEDAIQRGTVRRAFDSDGQTVWVPVDGARSRLLDRVESLFVADYLNTPQAYAELVVCPRCDAIVFDAVAKRNGSCGLHRPSGVVPRELDHVADSRRREPATA